MGYSFGQFRVVFADIDDLIHNVVIFISTFGQLPFQDPQTPLVEQRQVFEAGKQILKG